MRYYVVVLLLLLAIGSVLAADQAATQKISLSLADVDISQALTELSQKTQVSILGDSTVKGKINCQLNDVTLEQALDTICTINKLEWAKAYIESNSEEKPGAGSLFRQIDFLKGRESSPLIYQDPKTKNDTIFIPNAKAGTADIAGVASKLNLKAVYLLRVKPDPAAQAERERQRTERQGNQNAQRQQGNTPAAAPEVSNAAGAMWNSLSQLPSDQRFRAMRELQRMIFQNMTPEERESMGKRFGDRRGRQRDNQ